MPFNNLTNILLQLYYMYIQSFLIWRCTVEHITVLVASYKNDMASKFHILLLTLSHKESNLGALDFEAVDIQTF